MNKNGRPRCSLSQRVPPNVCYPSLSRLLRQFFDVDVFEVQSVAVVL
jgi:hypothetical protein